MNDERIYQPLRRWTVGGMIDCEENNTEGSTVSHRVVFTYVETELCTLVDMFHKSHALVNEKYEALGWTVKNSELEFGAF